MADPEVTSWWGLVYHFMREVQLCYSTNVKSDGVNLISFKMSFHFLFLPSSAYFLEQKFLRYAGWTLHDKVTEHNLLLTISSVNCIYEVGRKSFQV